MKYIILLGNVFTDRDWRRFGCESLVARGYKVVAVEMIGYINPGIQNRPGNGAFTSIDQCIRVQDDEHLEQVISAIEPADIVICDLIFNEDSAPAFWLMKKYDVAYAAISLGKIPSGWFSSVKAARGVAEYIKYKANDALSILYRCKIMMRYFVSTRIRWRDVQPPRWWLDAGAFHDMPTVNPVKLSQAERISVHSLDIEMAKTDEATKEEQDIVPDGPYALFLDNGYFGHPDYEFLGLRNPVSPERYAASLKRAFDTVERKFGLPVVISPHPKADAQLIRNHLGDRKIISGNSSLLTKNCEFVICHCSTSISYIVYYRKPAMFITTDELDACSFMGPMIVRISSWLGVQRINIDNETEVAGIARPNMDTPAYENYEQAFLFDGKRNNGSIWTVLAEHAERANGNKAELVTVGEAGPRRPRQTNPIRSEHPPAGDQIVAGNQ